MKPNPDAGSIRRASPGIAAAAAALSVLFLGCHTQSEGLSELAAAPASPSETPGAPVATRATPEVVPAPAAGPVVVPAAITSPPAAPATPAASPAIIPPPAAPAPTLVPEPPTASSTRKPGEGSVALDAVPQIVKDAALAAVPGLVLEEAESEVEKGVLVYELEGKVGRVEYEIEVTADGKVLEVEKDDDDDDDDDE